MLFWRHLVAYLVGVRLDVSPYNKDLKESQEASSAICLYLNCAYKSEAHTGG